MKPLWVAALAVAALAQTETKQDDPVQLATRMVQLMESTAVAVPGLVRDSDPIRQNAVVTLGSVRGGSFSPAPAYLFINQVKAYLALSDSIPRTEALPVAADQQFAELREDTQRMQRYFEALLQTQNAEAQARDADPSNLKRYAEANSKMLPAGKLPRVVFLGDSALDLWRLNEYFPGRDFVNRGIGGQTTNQMLGRFPDDVVGLHPRAVLILAGANDIARGVSLETIENDLTIMGDLAKAHSIRPVFASLLPVSDYHKDVDAKFAMTKTHPPAAIQQLNHWLQDYCHKEGFVFADFYTALVDSAGQLQAELSDNGLDPNAKGYRVMAPVALDAVGRVLSAEQAPPEEQTKRRFRILSK